MNKEDNILRQIYNKDKLMLVWLGYDDNKLISGTGTRCKNIWVNTMEEIRSKGNNWYSKPKNVVGVLLNAVDGKEPVDVNKTYIYYFLKGTEP